MESARRRKCKKSVSYFRRATDNDPSYAQGHAGLADSYNILGYYNALPPKEAYPLARASALKALELDPLLAEPHAALGVVARDFEWNWSAAQQEFQRAIDLNPGCVDAYHWRGTLFSMLGRHSQAYADKTKALSLDPLSVVVRADQGRISYFARDYDHALEHYRVALDLDAHFFFTRLGLAQVYQVQGSLKRAITELKKGVQYSDDSMFALARLGHGYALAGEREKARTVLKRLTTKSGKRYISSYDVAMIHAGLGRLDEAFAWFKRAFEERSLWLGYLKAEPQLDPLRADSRFKRLMKSVGLA